MVRTLKIGGIGFGIFVFLLISMSLLFSESLPKGKSGEKADDLARKILNALQYEAYQKTQFLEWTYIGHHYKWNKKDNHVLVKWKSNEVYLNLDSLTYSEVRKPAEQLDADAKNKLVKKAIDFFNNDSFWLIAPFKLFDKGTKRSIVKHNNQDCLLVTYTQGGSTPGDSYLWILDSDYVPTSYKMWVSIIPIGGLKASWDDWSTAETGFELSTKHKILFLTTKIKNFKAY